MIDLVCMMAVEETSAVQAVVVLNNIQTASRVEGYVRQKRKAIEPVGRSKDSEAGRLKR
jgi:hypothetical protein